MTEDGTVEGGLSEPDELEPEQGTLRLAAEEDVHEAAEWETAAAAVLRKARRLGDDDPDSAVWDALTRTTLDGIPVAPIGTPAALAGVETAGRPARAGDWDVRVQLGGDDASALNETALLELDTGATSLWLTLDDGTDLAAVLRGVLLDLAPVTLDATGTGRAAELVALLEAAPADPHPGTNLGADPLAARLRGRDAALDDVVSVGTLARDAGVLGVVVDATAVHDLGGSDAQELGWSMAVGATYLRLLTAAGFSVDEAAGLVEFRYAATDEQFPTIAKLRAARRLWARLLELSAATGEMRQHVVTSRPMMSKYDPWVNMLRTTVAAFAAGAGGADSVTVLPFDSPLGRSDAFGRRIARNTSALLISESHVARVADPAGGSYAVERLTDDLAAAGWEELGRIEEAGGAAAVLEDGSLRSRIDEVAARRDAEIANRTRPLTGVSEFPHLGERLPEREPDPSAPPVRRYAAPFEALRDAPAARPVFLATMGSIAQHTARATFATNLLAAGGVAVEVAGATDGVEALVSAYTSAGSPPVVCLAGTDATYADWGVAAAGALRAAGAAYVVLAGTPGERTGVGDDTVDDWVATGVDALAFLTRVREELGK